MYIIFLNFIYIVYFYLLNYFLEWKITDCVVLEFLWKRAFLQLHFDISDLCYLVSHLKTITVVISNVFLTVNFRLLSQRNVECSVYGWLRSNTVVTDSQLFVLYAAAKSPWGYNDNVPLTAFEEADVLK